MLHTISLSVVEVLASPEPERAEAGEANIEDFFDEDLDEILTIKLNIQEFTQTLQEYIHRNMELQECDLSRALVALTPEAASIPAAKLKNVSRLRTEHQVYELPQTHPLLDEVFLIETSSKKLTRKVNINNMEWWMKRRNMPPRLRNRIRNYN